VNVTRLYQDVDPASSVSIDSIQTGDFAVSFYPNRYYSSLFKIFSVKGNMLYLDCFREAYHGC